MTIADFSQVHRMSLVAVLRMPIAKFFFWLRIQSEVQRRRELSVVMPLVMSGQRGVEDDTFESYMDRLAAPMNAKEAQPTADPEHAERVREIASRLNSFVKGGCRRGR